MMKLEVGMFCVMLSAFPLLSQAGTGYCILNESGYPNASGEYTTTTGTRAFVLQRENYLSLIDGVDGAGQAVQATIASQPTARQGYSINYGVGGKSSGLLTNNCQEIYWGKGTWLRN